MGLKAQRAFTAVIDTLQHPRESRLSSQGAAAAGSPRLLLLGVLRNTGDTDGGCLPFLGLFDR